MTGQIKVGFGYDIHRFSRRRKLVLGGVHIPGVSGLTAYSDGDVLYHAICDALLGALGEGDIGQHFPSGDRRWKDVSSHVLMEKVMEKVKRAGMCVFNVDCTLVALRPRVSLYREAMRNNVACLLGIEPQNVNIKATTAERIGQLGHGCGIACYTVATLQRESQENKR
jgi:2-C-methyl-D-erythritol 2,4-cyclodiphosphate synthase